MRSLMFVSLCYYFFFFACTLTMPNAEKISVSMSQEIQLQDLQSPLPTSVTPNKSSKFLYFAYGSNLLAERIHINNPTAVKKTIAELKDYRLDFIGHSTAWHGSGATIVPAENSSVWGVVWEIDNSNMPHLDDQEGVACKITFPLTVQVKTTDGEILKCRCYQQTNNPQEKVELNSLPQERRPSPQYLNVILRGARENQLPEDYIKFLETVAHNGFAGTIEKSIGKHVNCHQRFANVSAAPEPVSSPAPEPVPTSG